MLITQVKIYYNKKNIRKKNKRIIVGKIYELQCVRNKYKKIYKHMACDKQK